MARVVHVWTPLPRFDDLAAYQRDRLSADRARLMTQAVEQVERALRGIDPLPTAVEASVVEGAPGAALVALSQDASLLVVGAAGRGSTVDGRPRVGATARYVTRHACCPVTVVGLGRPPVPGDVVTVPVRLPVPTA